MSALRRPFWSLLAAAVVLVEAATLLVLSVLVVADLGGGAEAGGIPTAVLLVAGAAGLGLCAVGMYRGHSWGRAPTVVAQLLLLGVAWDFHDGRLALSLGLAAVAVLALVALLHPATARTLE